MLEAAAEEIIDLLDCIGRPISIRSISDSGDAWNPSQAPADSPAIGAIASFKAGDVDGNIVQANDSKAYISSAYAVTKENKIVDKAIEYTIESVREVGPGVDTILYIAHLRK